MRKILKYSIILCLVWFFAHTAYIVYDGTKKPTIHADVAVILGNKVNEDGTLSVRLEKRLEAGLSLYEERFVDKIIVSGGLGKEGYYEGDKMREYLVSHGVPDSTIIVDNKGNNTETTVKNLVEIKKDDSFDSVIIVSQYFHITRTKQLFRQYGFDNLQSISPRYVEWRDLYAIVREFIAYYVNLL